MNEPILFFIEIIIVSLFAVALAVRITFCAYAGIKYTLNKKQRV
jgi:hypothetical protein